MAKYASVEDRFWSKVNKNGPIPTNRPELGPCWLWNAAQNAEGYGNFTFGGRTVKAHRFTYELLVGPIPEGLELDHLCRVHHCVNLAHLEPVTRSVNSQRGVNANTRKTHCPQGHPYDEGNTTRCKGRRYCRSCNRVQKRQWRKLNGMKGAFAS